MLDATVRTQVGSLSLEVELSVAGGEIAAVLGPNGAGKTSLLRALAGLIPLDSARVVLDGHTYEDTSSRRRVPTERRPIGFVFQDYLLFPHLSVLENVAYGLRARGWRRADARRAARGWLERMALVKHADSKPRDLSGGQAQRASLARALAIEPKLLLLDEPMSALDAGARAEVRRDLRRHLRSFPGTRLLVTHDPLEALVLADRVVIVEDGKIVQVGTVDDLRAKPRSSYVAELVGLNLYRGTAANGRIEVQSGGVITAASGASGEVFAAIHPRAVALYSQRPEGSPRNVWPGRVRDLDFEGDRVRVRLDGPVPVVAEVTAAAVSDLLLAEGDDAWAAVKASEISVYAA
jgi:molybdate transport system ATP-binding protein